MKYYRQFVETGCGPAFLAMVTSVFNAADMRVCQNMKAILFSAGNPN
jgi:hypothetical protein